MSSLWWQVMTDSEWKQRRDINALQSEETVTEWNLSAVATQMFAMQKTLRDLQVLVGVMGRMLHEADLLDPKILRYRIEAAMENDAPEAAAIDPSAIKCIDCGRAVDPHLATLTPFGSVCIACAPRGQGMR